MKLYRVVDIIFIFRSIFWNFQLLMHFSQSTFNILKIKTCVTHSSPPKKKKKKEIKKIE